MPSAMTLSAATAAAVARSLNAAEAARRPGALRERLVEARDGRGHVKGACSMRKGFSCYSNTLQ